MRAVLKDLENGLKRYENGVDDSKQSPHIWTVIGIFTGPSAIGKRIIAEHSKSDLFGSTSKLTEIDLIPVKDYALGRHGLWIWVHDSMSFDLRLR